MENTCCDITDKGVRRPEVQPGSLIQVSILQETESLLAPRFFILDVFFHHMPSAFHTVRGVFVCLARPRSRYPWNRGLLGRRSPASYWQHADIAQNLLTDLPSTLQRVCLQGLFSGLLT